MVSNGCRLKFEPPNHTEKKKLFTEANSFASTVHIDKLRSLSRIFSSFCLVPWKISGLKYDNMNHCFTVDNSLNVYFSLYFGRCAISHSNGKQSIVIWLCLNLDCSLISSFSCQRTEYRQRNMKVFGKCWNLSENEKVKVNDTATWQINVKHGPCRAYAYWAQTKAVG